MAMAIEEKDEPGLPPESAEPAAESAQDTAQPEGEDDVVETPEGQARKATPEQEEEAEDFKDKALTLIYNKGEANPAIRKMLSTGNNPIMALAQATVSVTFRVVDAFKDEGKEMDHLVLFGGGQMVYAEIAKMAALAGIHEYSEVEMDKGWPLVAHLAYPEMKKRGMIDEESQARSLEEMKRADAEGRLDEVLPGLGELPARMEAMRKKQGAAPEQGKEMAPAEEDNGGLL